MLPTSPSRRVCDLERLILRMLCQPSLPDTLRQSVSRDLSTHQWQVEDHRIVFAALQKVRNTSAASLREQLTAHATRMGFPDIDWAILFEPNEVTESIEQVLADFNAAVRIR